MGLKKLFKRRSRNEVGKLASSGKIDLAGPNTIGTSQHGWDESTASESSGNAKVAILESYARNGKWDAVVKLVQESHADEWMSTAISTTTSSSHSESSLNSLHENTTPLHLALQHRPPVPTIDALIQIMQTKFEIPSPEESQDEQGRTPLHVAVAAGCDEETVVRLLNGDGLVMPAVLRDARGQTALHTACATPIVALKKKNFMAANPVAMQKWYKRRVMGKLMEEYSEAVYLKDDAGKTPVDYCKELGFNDMVTQEMERMYHGYLAEMAPPAVPEPAHPHEMSAMLRDCDVPLIVPSPEGSCRDFAKVSSLRLEDVLDHGIQAEPSDVSTIGDNEVEMEL